MIAARNQERVVIVHGENPMNSIIVVCIIDKWHIEICQIVFAGRVGEGEVAERNWGGGILVGEKNLDGSTPTFNQIKVSITLS